MTSGLLRKRHREKTEEAGGWPDGAAALGRERRWGGGE